MSCLFAIAINVSIDPVLKIRPGCFEDWFLFPENVKQGAFFSRSWDPDDLGYFDHADYEFGGFQAKFAHLRA